MQKCQFNVESTSKRLIVQEMAIFLHLEFYMIGSSLNLFTLQTIIAVVVSATFSQVFPIVACKGTSAIIVEMAASMVFVIFNMISNLELFLLLFTPDFYCCKNIIATHRMDIIVIISIIPIYLHRCCYLHCYSCLLNCYYYHHHWFSIWLYRRFGPIPYKGIHNSIYLNWFLA